MKLPSLQFYPGDWRKDPGVQSLTFHDRGIWFELLLLMHESSDRGKLLLNGLPFPEDALARLLGLDKQSLTNAITTLLACGVASRDPDTGALMNRRMVRDEQIRQIRAESGKKGGNPVLLNQKATMMDKQNQTIRVKRNPTPSSSSSSSCTTSVQADPPTPHPEKSKPRLVREGMTDVPKLIDFYLDEFQKTFNSNPDPPNLKKYVEIQEKIDRFGLDEMKRRLRCYLHDPRKSEFSWRFEFFLAAHMDYDQNIMDRQCNQNGTEKNSTAQKNTINNGINWLAKKGKGDGN